MTHTYASSGSLTGVFVSCVVMAGLFRLRRRWRNSGDSSRPAGRDDTHADANPCTTSDPDLWGKVDSERPCDTGFRLPIRSQSPGK